MSDVDVGLISVLFVLITVYIGKETGRPTPLSEEIRAALQKVALIEA